MCTLGNFATKLLRGDPTGITRLHGRAEERLLGPRRVRLYPLFHPGGGALHAVDARDAAGGLPADPGAPGAAGPARAGREPSVAEPIPQPEPDPTRRAAGRLVDDAAATVSWACSRPRSSASVGLRRRVLVGGDRVALVVAPLAADQQVARREALEAEAGAARERDRRLVAGLDVRLDAGAGRAGRTRGRGSARAPRASGPGRRGARGRSSRGRRTGTRRGRSGRS